MMPSNSLSFQKSSRENNSPSTLRSWLATDKAVDEIVLADVESGIAEDLYSTCVEVFENLWIYQFHKGLNIPSRDARQIKQTLYMFRGWGHGFDHGRLDMALSTSEDLMATVLSQLQKIGRLLLKGYKQLGVVIYLKKQGQKAALLYLQNLLEKTYDITTYEDSAASDDTSSDENSSSNDESERQCVANTLKAAGPEKYWVQDGPSWITRFQKDISGSVTLLMDMVVTLEQSLVNNVAKTKHSTIPAQFYLSGPAQAYVSIIGDKFKSADHELVQRVGEAQWQRHIRVRAVMEGEKDNETVEQVLQQSKTQSIFMPFSTFYDSGLGSSIAKVLTYAPSNASHTSYVSSIGDGESKYSFRVPPTPTEVGSGKPFLCPICTKQLFGIKNRIDWKLHVFTDLQPYICTFSACKDKLLTFPSRKLWSDHEFSVHRNNKLWTCPACISEFDETEMWKNHVSKIHDISFSDNVMEQMAISAATKSLESNVQSQPCPFCHSATFSSKRAFITHVGRHMEEISLRALPGDNVSDIDESDSISATSSEDKEFPKEVSELNSESQGAIQLAGGIARIWRLAKIVRHANKEFNYKAKSIVKAMARPILVPAVQLAPKRCQEPGCTEEFQRNDNITRHEDTHPGPWKCPEVTCKYRVFGHNKEKQLERHKIEKHFDTAILYKCIFLSCAYQSKCESNLEWHLQESHKIKPIYQCDYRVCSNLEDFDHYSGMFLHYQCFHHEHIFSVEDLNGIKIDEWLADRSDNPPSWRCSRCLKRPMPDSTWLCSYCWRRCEPQRIAKRQADMNWEIADPEVQIDNLDLPRSILQKGDLQEQRQ